MQLAGSRRIGMARADFARRAGYIMNMRVLKLIGKVDASHQLTAQVPEDLEPGPVEVTLRSSTSGEQPDSLEWSNGISREWAAELTDPREDIDCEDDGKPLDEAR